MSLVKDGHIPKMHEYIYSETVSELDTSSLTGVLCIESLDATSDLLDTLNSKVRCLTCGIFYGEKFTSSMLRDSRVKSSRMKIGVK